MGTFLMCCLWGQGWIGGRPGGAIGWLLATLAERLARVGSREPLGHELLEHDARM